MCLFFIVRIRSSLYLQFIISRYEAITYDKTEDNTVHANNKRFTRNTSSQENSGLIFEKSILEETHVDTSGDIERQVVGKLYIQPPRRTL